MGSFEIREHTADVGIGATGTTLEEVFEQATLGLAEIMGIGTADQGKPHVISLESDDLGALLVDWLSEVLYLHEVHDALLAGVVVQEVAHGGARGEIELTPRRAEVGGTQVKAITYHQLKVEPTSEGWAAEVYVDV